MSLGPAVVAEEVAFAYGDRVALDRSTFEIPAGAVTALIGPNGSGKSTLLNGIAGLIPPVAGRLVLHPPGAPVSYVLQSTKVNEGLPVTVREVVQMGRYATRGWLRPLSAGDNAAVDEALARLDITGVANRHLRELSGGQRQRVFVAQGLAQDHELLLLDEPITGLDLVSAQAIGEIIRQEQTAGTTVIVTTHDLVEARTADHVLLLSGRVVAWGSPDQVLTTDHLASAYGAGLLHIEEARLFLDDPHHHPAATRRLRERSIHTEVRPTDAHPPQEH